MICVLALNLIAYYAAFGIAAIGFSVMIAGEHGARAVARFWFARPAAALGRAAGRGMIRLMTGIGTLILATANGIITHVIDPIARAIVSRR